MNQQVFQDSVDPRCFMLVDGQAVSVVPGNSEVPQLLSEQDARLGRTREGKSDIRMVQVGGERDKSGIKEDPFEEVLGMKDEKMEVRGMVQVVHVEGGKTLEVMHLDTGKQLQVIHIEGGGKLDEGRARVGQVGGGMQRVRRVVSYPHRRHHTAPGLRSLGQQVTQPVVLSAGQGGLVPGHSYRRLPSGNITSHEMDSNTIISGDKEGLGGTEVALDEAIVISWPPITQKLNNSVGTQTEPCKDLGLSLNLFSCTFHVDGCVETYCDLPLQDSTSLSTGSRARCRDKRKLWGQHPRGEEEEKALLSVEEIPEEDEELRQKETNRRFSRSGRVLKGKGLLFKADLGASEEDLEGDPDFEVPEEEKAEDAAPQSIPLRRKRGRKRKRRPPPPSPDGFEQDLQLADSEHEEGEVKEDEEKIDVKDEQVDGKPKSESEVAQEVVRKKGYSLRTKRRPKKLTDMHYLKEQLVRRDQPDSDRLLTCRVCNHPFPTFPKLQRHAKQEHGLTNFSFPCDVCGIAFTRPNNLERHKDTKHGTGQKRYACELCNRRFARQDVLSVHVSMVHLRRTGGLKGPLGNAAGHHCTGCDNYFSHERRLNEHRRGDFTCKECNISFECRTALRLHLYRSHPTACTDCGKVCNNKQQMYFHRMSHTPKLFCKFCEKGFMWRSQYVVHMATHTGDRPVPCDVCGRTFAHKVAVTKHKWQEHNENNRKFKCEQCGKSFVYRGKLASHMRSHTGEKPYTCHACPSTFTQRSNLTAHVKSVHGVVIKSVKSDGTMHTEVVKYKRPKKAPAPSSAPPSTEVGSAGVSQEVELSPAAPQPPHIDIQDQVQVSESSLETEAAVYQIVYAYPQ
ncbi:zinc finger and SCAN domain-containing protein 12-like [Eriocheir sinensis]|uniref:zinc finger and SCAN domain-containing protein 12-like n=1 Tax=Eriocheir sinensis TaxID=95602 RepID=UPI0021CAD5D8|nr:zinc finger and SCAN domain-containing protein 12-like [Eriocheir sinensis]XP_050712276.1 zinc finger and SCAN domain-containing protein 12-like [Eriocheir sinensis]XP_050712277.1 zinc finger and SCAN domain-containing protein 12-like [Eriocheir sinensis]